MQTVVWMIYIRNQSGQPHPPHHPYALVQRQRKHLLMARAANLQEKQATKEEEQMLRKRRETLEWYMKLAATTAKSKRDWNVNA